MTRSIRCAIRSTVFHRGVVTALSTSGENLIIFSTVRLPSSPGYDPKKENDFLNESAHSINSEFVAKALCPAPWFCALLQHVLYQWDSGDSLPALLRSEPSPPMPAFC